MTNTRSSVTRRFAHVSAGVTAGLVPAFASAAEGGGMPQFDLSTFPTQFAWLAITFVLLFLAMRQIALPRIADVLEARRNRIDGDLDRAASMKEEAEAALAVYEATVAESIAKAHELKRQMTTEFSKQAAQARSELATRLAEQARVAESLIADEKARSLSGIRDVAAELVRASASKLADIELSYQDAAAAISAVAPEDK